jgi:hypothetical protein
VLGREILLQQQLMFEPIPFGFPYLLPPVIAAASASASTSRPSSSQTPRAGGEERMGL